MMDDSRFFRFFFPRYLNGQGISFEVRCSVLGAHHGIVSRYPRFFGWLFFLLGGEKREIPYTLDIEAMRRCQTWVTLVVFLGLATFGILENRHSSGVLSRIDGSTTGESQDDERNREPLTAAALPS
jgi:hypothetical protein